MADNPEKRAAPLAESLAKTPLHGLHLELGGKMVPFAGYEMPVQYPAGILKEHLHTREQAGLFDISHMGQAELIGDDTLSAAIERLVPGDIAGLAPGAMRYTLLLNEDGGIRDDLMVTRLPNEGDETRFFLVVNAACKHQDFAHIGQALDGVAHLEQLEARALLALQGPQAARVMARVGFQTDALPFMHATHANLEGVSCFITRSGYTGEDGFEISAPAEEAARLARTLLSHEDVRPAGLGARDSLRLEAGLCLYGHDIDETTTPVEASLTWTIAKRRRTEGGFPGAQRILDQIENGAVRKRVGILPEGKAPAREGTPILSPQGDPIGQVTSGGFGPSVGRPVAMGYVSSGHAARDTAVELSVRGKAHPAKVASMPFVPHRYYRGR